jgi:hypothetical protein
MMAFLRISTDGNASQDAAQHEVGRVDHILHIQGQILKIQVIIIVE